MKFCVEGGLSVLYMILCWPFSSTYCFLSVDLLDFGGSRFFVVLDFSSFVFLSGCFL